MRRKTLEQLKQEMLKINPTIEISGVYINNKTPVLCKCKICGHEWGAAPNNLTSGHGCPGCKSIKIIDRQTKSLDEVLSDFRNIHGYKYDYSKVEYVNGKTKVCITCPKHGEFWQEPQAHAQGQGCPHCYNDRRGESSKKTTQLFIEEAIKIHGDKYDYSKVEYLGCDKPVCIICPTHGEFWQTPSIHLSNHGCVKCSGKEIFNKEDFLTKAVEIHGTKYDYSKVDYINTETKVCIICKKHGEFWQTPHSHISDKAGCPKCSLSHGEELIETFLLKQGIEYISLYPIILETNVSNKAFIDFYLPKYNLYIEYNGIQHYIPIEHFGGKIQFEKQQIRDNSVRNYCKNKNIKLLEISYKLSESEVVNVLKGELL